MFRVGLTGGIGSGKSVVARVFGVLGVPVFLADEEARKLQDTHAGLRQAISERFGAQLYATGPLDRKALAAIVFSDTAALRDLSAMVHPRVRDVFRTWAERQVGPYVIMEAAILLESGGHEAFDHIVLVTAPEEVRIQRVMARDRATREQVLARLRNQAGEKERAQVADTSLMNDGHTLLIPQVLALHARLLSLAAA